MSRGRACVWVVATAVAGALVAVSIPVQILLGSGYERLWSGVPESLAKAAAVGAVIGTGLALFGVLRRPIVHPSLGLWLLVLFGNTDWLGDTTGLLRLWLQCMLLVSTVVAAVALRHADWRLGTVAGVVLVVLVTTPMGTLLWKNALPLADDQWWFAPAELVERVRGREVAAPERGRKPSERPDIWLVVADHYPSVSEASRRGIPYPAAGLSRLRDRGWRIRDDAQTGTPNTKVTFTHTLSLSTRLTNGEQEAAATPGRLAALFTANALRWERTFERPPLLEILESAGYDARGWFGWWLETQYLPFPHMDKSRDAAVDYLNETAIAGWLWTHLGGQGWRNRTMERSIVARYYRDFEQNCRELSRQRERFFSFESPEGEGRAPLFVLYHLLWLHDKVAMDASGECQAAEADAFDLPEEHSPWIGYCKELQEQGVKAFGWAPGCLPEHVRHQRAGRLVAYLPAFLERLERHASKVAGGRPFRILVLADEGLAFIPSEEAESPFPNVWRSSGSWHKHPAVFRGEFGKGVTRLWPEQEIPDVPQAMRDVVLDLFGVRGESGPAGDGVGDRE